MSENRKSLFVSAIVVLIAIISALGYWAWKYYVLPELEDMEYIGKLVESVDRPILLWNYCSK